MVLQELADELGASKTGVINQAGNVMVDRQLLGNSTSYSTAVAAGTYWTFLYRAMQGMALKEMTIRMHALANHSGTLDIIKAPSGVDPTGTVNVSGNVGPLQLVNTIALSSGSIASIVADTDYIIGASGIIPITVSGTVPTPVISVGDVLFAKMVATSGETTQTPIGLQMKFGV